MNEIVTNNGCVIREMADSEIDEVLNLHILGLERELELVNQLVPQKSVDCTGRPQLKKILLQMKTTGEANCFVARKERDLLGYCLATKKVYPIEEPKVCGCINGIFVADDARRLGLGKHLFDIAKKWFEREGVGYVELYHMINDERAKAFWEKMGFAPIQYSCALNLKK